MKRVLRMARAVAVMSVSTLVLFVLVEGATSLLLVVNEVGFADAPTTNEYDASLGWTGRRNLMLPDFYGPGRSVVLNSKGFRNEAEFDDAVPDGVDRIVCSGDSFTFGAGVGNGETWCDLLRELGPDLESVNLGVSGYSVGQAMLRYEAVEGLDHTVHIFAFISSDLPRTTRPSHLGYGRPVMRIDDGVLVVENVPVPRLRNSVVRGALAAGSELRSVDFLGRVMRRFLPHSETNRQELVSTTAPIVSEIFSRVDEVTAAREARAVFVYLPHQGDLDGPDEWERSVAEAMDRLGLAFVDLAVDLRGVPEDLAASYFIPIGQPGQTHYTRSGNRWVADVLHRRLRDGLLLASSSNERHRELDSGWGEQGAPPPLQGVEGVQ
jgi:hypothetical protein